MGHLRNVTKNLIFQKKNLKIKNIEIIVIKYFYENKFQSTFFTNLWLDEKFSEN